MAYFPNGCSGEVLDEQCGKCLIHNEWPCPVLFVQSSFNYKQIDIPQLREAMDMLINKKGICQMKLLLDKVTPEYLEHHLAELNGQMRLFE